MYGKIKEPDTLIMRNSVGSATDEETGITYEMSTSISNNSPLIRSSKTKKWFSLPWESIVNLAVDEGIDVEEGGG